MLPARPPDFAGKDFQPKITEDRHIYEPLTMKCGSNSMFGRKRACNVWNIMSGIGGIENLTRWTSETAISSAMSSKLVRATQPSRSAAFRGSPIKASISENRKNFGCYRPAFCSASREAVK